MTLSRKEFFRHGFYELGKAVLAVGTSVKDAQAALRDATTIPSPSEGLRPAGGTGAGVRAASQEGALEPQLTLENGGGAVVAQVDNRHCIARNCGCFSCVEHCEAGAITLSPGTGIGIDAGLCTGCGECCSICPLAPQALKLVPRG